MSNFFYSLISLIISLFFILVGIVAIMIPWSEDTRTSLIQFILEDSLAISLFGFTIMVIGLAIAINILLGTRRRYYHITSHEAPADVDEAIVQQYLTSYWKQLFPGSDIPCRLTIKNNKFHISVDFPYLPLDEQKELLERIKRELRITFAKVLGYHEDFHLSATFQAAKK